MKVFFSMAFGLLVVITSTTAQIFAPIKQTYASMQRSALLEHLPGARPDSNKLELLLDISDAYLKANLPDSALFYSSQATALSRSLDMREGLDQADFLACRADAMKNDIPAAEAVIRQAEGRQVSGIWEMRMLQALSEYYSFRPGNLPSNLDSAWPYIRQAIALTDTMHCVAATQNVRAIMAKYCYARGETKKGVDYFMQNIRDWQLAGDKARGPQWAEDKAREAHWWSELGIYTPGTVETISTILQANRNAINLYFAAGSPKDAYYSLIDLAEWHWLIGQVQLAEQEQREANDSLEKRGQRDMFVDYRKLATYELCLGNHNLALKLMLKAKKNMEALHRDYWAGNLDKHLADVYWEENDVDKALNWYETSLRETQGRRDLAIYGIALRIVQALLAEKRVTEAEHFLVRFVAQEPPVRNIDKETIATGWGDIFVAKGEYKNAERYYLEMIRFYDLTIEDSKKDIEVYFDYDITRSEANYKIARFYVNEHQFVKARPYLLRSLDPQRLIPEPVDILRDDHLLLFKVDSAAGNLASAMEQRLLYEKYADSISSSAKAREIAELQIQYETDKKDRDITLLNKQAQLQTADLARGALIRNIGLGGLLLTLAIIALLYNQYRIKQKNNRTLVHLLDEKEWLLKEIHHRVKNNLQMVVSLLGSQSAYLSNEALEAIKDSQNRVFSISLIHQNLYQNDNLASIEMSDYVPELVSYIRDIFGVKNQICFNLEIEPLKLNMSQAVSLGLILNEAITNCIKYAFQAKRKGDTITISMALHERGIVYLEIADNGVGLPADFDSKRPKSLGLRLIKGLTEDLGGSFSIGSRDGSAGLRGGTIGLRDGTTDSRDGTTDSRDGTTVSIHFVPNISFEKAIEIIASDETATSV